MIYYVLKPEVAGSYGPNTVFVDLQSRPPEIEKFNYEFDGWLGDQILEVMCNYIVTETLRDRILQINPTGVQFSEVEITTSSEYDEWQKNIPGVKLPAFVWLRVTGRGGDDDFGYTASDSAYLVVSERILDLLLSLGTAYCDLVELDFWNRDKFVGFRRQK